MANGVYMVNGEQLANLKEVAEVLGTKVTKKAVLAGEVPEVAWVEVPEDYVAEEEVATDEVEDTVDDGMEVPDDADSLDEDASDDSEDDDTQALTNEGTTPTLEELMAKLKRPEPKTKAGKVKEDLANEEVEYPEVGHFKTEKELKRFYKRLSNDQLDEWLELEGITDEVKPTDNGSILRMRKCMAILYKHFPKQSKGSSKKKSPYADYSTEQLLEIALENDVEVRDSKGNEQILRMYTIMALRDAGLLPA